MTFYVSASTAQDESRVALLLLRGAKRGAKRVQAQFRPI